MVLNEYEHRYLRKYALLLWNPLNFEMMRVFFFLLFFDKACTFQLEPVRNCQLFLLKRVNGYSVLNPKKHNQLNRIGETKSHKHWIS